jgi:hypothetical protein
MIVELKQVEDELKAVAEQLKAITEAVNRIAADVAAIAQKSAGDGTALVSIADSIKDLKVMLRTAAKA